MDLTGFELGTLAAAGFSALVSMASAGFAYRSAKEAKRQGDVAERAVSHAQQAAQSAAVIHFTDRFFDLMRSGPNFENKDWAYQFWSLQATESYFFDNNWLPQFMYELWMVELVHTYRTYPLSRASHQRYVTRYALNYPEMTTFFDGLRQISKKEFSDDVVRHKAITSTPTVDRDLHGPLACRR
jgi:hypothetical protein